MFWRCKHQWLPRSCSHEFKGWGDKATVIALTCSRCGDVRTKTINGWHQLADLVTATDRELERFIQDPGERKS